MGNEAVPSLNWEIGRTLYVAKGNSTKKGNYLYFEQLEAAMRYCKEAAEFIKEQETMTGANTVVGIAGSRGSGKSSFLYSLKNALSDEFFVLDVVDPSDFDSDMSILEFFLAHLFEAYKNCYKEYEKKHGELAALSLHGEFKKLTKTLSELRIDKSVYNDGNPSIEILSSMADRVNIRHTIRKICCEFLSIANAVKDRDEKEKKSIVLCVDDIDLVENRHVYRMLEDMRKFLSGSVVIVLTYRERQLFNAVLDEKITENDNLLKNKVIQMDELQNQVYRYIVKLFPEMRIVHLYSQEDLLSRPIVEVLGPLGGRGEKGAQDNYDERHYVGGNRQRVTAALIHGYSNSKNVKSLVGLNSATTVKEWIDLILYEKVLIKIDPVNSLERTPYIYPRNLREIIAFVELIHVKMRKVSIAPSTKGSQEAGNNKQKTELPYWEVCLENLELYRRHILSNLSEALSNKDIDCISQWIALPAEKKNHYAYSILLEKYRKLTGDNSKNLTDSSIKEDETQGLLAVHLIVAENVCIGDVSDIMNRYVGAYSRDSEAVYFSYILKLLYSMELLTLLLHALQCQKGTLLFSKAINDYLSIINACVVSPYSSMSNTVEEFYLATDQEIGSLLGRDFLQGNTADSFSKKESPNISISRINEMSFSLEDESIDAAEENQGEPNEQMKQLLEWFCYSRIPIVSAIHNAATPRYGHGKRVTHGYRSRGIYSYDLNDVFPVLFSRQRYSIDPLSMLAKRQYVEHCLSILKEGWLDNLGVYVLYSMFDIDVFQRLTLSSHGKKGERMRGYLARYNSMILYSCYEELGFVDIDEILRNDDETVVRLRVSSDIQVSEKICSKFVFSEQYRLFGNGKKAHYLFDETLDDFQQNYNFPLTFNQLDSLFFASGKLLDVFMSWQENIDKMDFYISSMKNKDDFIALSNALVQLLRNESQALLRKRLRDSISRMIQPRMSIRQEDREILRDVLKQYPRLFIRAYNEVVSHE